METLILAFFRYRALKLVGRQQARDDALQDTLLRCAASDGPRAMPLRIDDPFAERGVMSAALFLKSFWSVLTDTRTPKVTLRIVQHCSGQGNSIQRKPPRDRVSVQTSLRNQIRIIRVDGQRRAAFGEARRLKARGWSSGRGPSIHQPLAHWLSR